MYHWCPELFECVSMPGFGVRMRYIFRKKTEGRFEFLFPLFSKSLGGHLGVNSRRNEAEKKFPRVRFRGLIPSFPSNPPDISLGSDSAQLSRNS